jgi:peroxiredoxin
MKKVLFFITLNLGIFISQAQTKNIIRGIFPQKAHTKLFISYLPTGLSSVRHIDSCLTDATGKFAFNVPFTEPVLAAITENYNESFTFVTDYTIVKLTSQNKSGAFSFAEIKAISPVNKQYDIYKSFIRKEHELADSLYNLRERFRNERKKDSIDLLLPKLEYTDSIILIKNLSFIKSNKYAPIIRSLITYRKVMLKIKVQDLVIIYSSFPLAAQSSIYGRAIAEYISSKGKLKKGEPAPDFVNQLSPEGKSIRISDFKGKNLLLDFWAAWCGPCREQNPTLKKLYEKYSTNNFEILGISLDKKKEDWLKAITIDKLPWPQASDLKFWDSECVELFGLYSLPYNVLLDVKGHILGVNLTIEDIESKVKQLTVIK